eukprot:TRINITY_DN2371_c0_g1_i1.p1 TRINITY_DN2371_c0_g1~~TRINITY_DN2371_c0_g1_i1.p1  ORF type:complete len:355 (-),score=42.61 TRINITY_DN2371_c0_g1_i1:24-1061(-)
MAISLAVGRTNGIVDLLADAQGSLTVVASIETHQSGTINSVAISPDRRWVAAATKNGVFLVDVATRSLAGRLPDHEGNSEGVVWSREGSLVLAGANDGTARVWRAETLTLVRKLQGHTLTVRGVGFSCDNFLAATCGADSFLVVYDTNSWTEKSRINMEHIGCVISFHPYDPPVAAVGLRGSMARVYNCVTGQLLKQFSGTGPNYFVQSVQFSSSGQHLLMAASVTFAHVIDLVRGEPALKIDKPDPRVSSLKRSCFSPDDRSIVFGGETVKICAIETGEVSELPVTNSFSVAGVGALLPWDCIQPLRAFCVLRLAKVDASLHKLPQHVADEVMTLRSRRTARPE